MKVTIRNNFHNTERTVRLVEGENEIRGRRLKEWKKALCCSDCTCSGVSGLRGDFDNPSMVSSEGNYVVWWTSYDSETGEEYISVRAEKRKDQ
jgi:hypothetical protein